MSAKDSVLPPLMPPQDANAKTTITIEPGIGNMEKVFMSSVELLHILHDIQVLRANALQPGEKDIQQIFCLQQRMLQFRRNSPHLRFEESYEEYTRPYMNVIFFLHSVYNLAMISLHSFVIPFFSARSINDCLPSELLQQCTYTTVSHAEKFVIMLNHFVSAGGKVAELPPYVGYCSFVTTYDNTGFPLKDWYVLNKISGFKKANSSGGKVEESVTLLERSHL
ncbi:hypothetical protein N7462_008459 [Penicillium macrosclerotiorum]|uniref:uncharacterized protein n=1 Tax=Penicillium macrosclerotiorum TaxID=303699 RepID=UPI002546C3EC|nr:uncharacterized protein N7462_008459 [Penicillium macrosclerotiorum]KAJ5675562.1 hypothetical protein N7462_008459 [Penicillium macrosclerotiorum]